MSEIVEEKTLKESPAVQVAQVVQATEEPEIRISATKWCKDKSKTDNRVELLGAFFFWVQNVKKIYKGTRKQYNELFESFVDTPV